MPSSVQVTVNEAAESLGVSPRRIRQFIEEGRLRATRIGGRNGKSKSGMFLIRQSDLERFADKPRFTGNKTGRPRIPKSGARKGQTKPKAKPRRGGRHGSRSVPPAVAAVKPPS